MKSDFRKSKTPRSALRKVERWARKGWRGHARWKPVPVATPQERGVNDVR